MRDDLLHQFRQTHAGDPWYGPARATLLEGISASDAARHPVPGAHSMWELVLHMTSWTNLASEIAELSDAALVRRVGDQRDPALGSGVSVGGLLVGIAQHDAYHNGQLAVLRRALGVR